MVLDFIAEMGAWTWWIVGLGLLILEVIAPGVFFLWLGLAALVTGTVALIVTVGWQVQLVMFAVLSAIFVIVGRKMLVNRSDAVDNPHLNDRAGALVGQTFVLEDALTGGRGRMKVGDTYWAISGDDMPAGAKVKVRSAEDSLLVVEAV